MPDPILPPEKFINIVSKDRIEFARLFPTTPFPVPTTTIDKMIEMMRAGETSIRAVLTIYDTLYFKDR